MESTKQRRKKNKTYILRSLVGVLCAIVIFSAGWMASRYYTPSSSFLLKKASAQNSQTLSTSGMGKKLTKETVDVIGGSMAHGWLDPHDNSYLQRAFTARTQSTNTTYHYVSHTVAGQTPYLLDTKNKSQYLSWLKKDHPQVVVLSFGVENSMSSRHKTTLDQFKKSFHDLIAEALKEHAVVLIVTPPVTQELIVNDRLKTDQWFNQMFQVANAFNSSNLYIEDLYHQMTLYMAAHGKTYKDYYGNSWHPNQAGHALAGSLLANGLVKTFGFGPILFKS